MENVESVRLDEDTLYVSIPFAEYKELLIIKGKYEELKSKLIQPIVDPMPWRTNITYKDLTKSDERKVTCEK